MTHPDSEPTPSGTPGGITRLGDVAELVALAALYVAAARIGLAVDTVAGFATLVWPPSGIALAALLLRGYRLWPGIMVGAFVANVWTGAPFPVALGMATGNTLEALLATYALGRIPGFHTSLDRVRDVLGIIVFAAALSTMVSATIGVASLYLGGVVPTADIGRAWRTWWLGDAIGDLLVAPVLLVWATAPRVRPARRRWLEIALLAASVIVVGLMIFGRPATARASAFQQAYLIFPTLTWAALRFRQRGAATTALVVSLVALWGTAMGRGPFTQPALHESLFALQIFMAVSATTFLLLGASIAERRLASRELEAAITEQQRLHAERDIAHQRLLTVLEQSPVAIGIAEAPSGRFLFLNGEAERLLGRRLMDHTVGDPHDSWHSFSLDGRAIAPHEGPLARALHHGEVVRNEVIRIARSDGTVVEIATNAAPVLDGRGSIIAGVVIFWDVTAERRAEEEQRRAHETIAAANRAKAEFFAVMSHELRTPLNAIGGYVEVMGLGIQGPVTEQQQDSLERIRRNQQHLLSVIDDVLVFAKLEADRLPIELEKVDVQTALDELDALVRPALERKQITLTCHECAASLSVLADPEKLRQILLNVVGNAIKFTPDGGRITVDAVRERETVRIAVTDTGIGIPAEQLSRIFEPFFQVERGPTRRFPGVGLGLSIAHDLARAMRGDLTVVSRLDEGTTISVALPAA